MDRFVTSIDQITADRDLKSPYFAPVGAVKASRENIFRSRRNRLDKLGTDRTVKYEQEKLGMC